MEGKYHISLLHKELKFITKNTLSKNLSNQKGPRISNELEGHDHTHGEEIGKEEIGKKSGY